MMKNLILVLVLNLVSLLVFAQNNITIKVVDAKTGTPITNASIKIKNTGKGGITNATGTYQLQAPANTEIEVSSIGYSTTTVK
jgi:hypothetical protein